MKNFDDILKKSNGHKAENPFQVPEGYFETFEDRLEAQLEAMNEQKPGTRTIVRILKPVLGLAACFLLVMLLIKYPLKEITPILSSEELTSKSDSSWFEEIFVSNATFFDDNALLQNIEGNESQNPAGSDELINYLSTELNDYEVFAELNNQ
jgi:hypothetical protein